LEKAGNYGNYLVFSKKSLISNDVADKAGPFEEMEFWDSNQ